MARQLKSADADDRYRIEKRVRQMFANNNDFGGWLSAHHGIHSRPFTSLDTILGMIRTKRQVREIYADLLAIKKRRRFKIAK